MKTYFNNSKQMKRAMIAMDLSKMDDTLIQYAKFVNIVFDLDKMYFVHIIPDLLVPKNIDLSFHNKFTQAVPIDEKVKSLLSKKLSKSFEDFSDIENIEIEVIEGSPYRTLIRRAKIKEIDLLITGIKKKSKGSGITSKRVAHNIDCNILFVPEVPELNLRKLLIPIDFSEFSLRAIHTALEIKKSFPDMEITLVHLIRMRSTDYYFALNVNPDYRKLFLKESKEVYLKFLEKYDLAKNEFHSVFIEDTYDNISKHLCEYIEQKDFDLVIMGAKGHSNFENFFFGSTTERFVDRCKDTTVMVVR